MLGPLRQFLRLDRARRRLFLEAWWELGAVRLALSSRTLKQMVSGMDVHRGSHHPPNPGAEAEKMAFRVGWAVRTAALYTPWRSTCLVQVLAGQRMLERRLLPGRFFIGAAPGEGGGRGLDAHAWLKCGETFVTGESGHERYVVVSEFSWS